MVDAVDASTAIGTTKCLDEDTDGVVYEHVSHTKEYYVKISYVAGRRRLVVGVATPSSYEGDIVSNPVRHAVNVGHRDISEDIEHLLAALNKRDDIRDVRASQFDIDGVHSRFHDMRRTYFSTDLREERDI